MRSRLVLAAAVILLLAGVGLAVAKPGNLGDDNDSKPSAAATTTSTLGESTTSSSEAATTTTTTTVSTSTSVAGGGDASGLGTNGSGSAGRRGLANTGGPAYALPGALVLLVALTARRTAARR